MEFKDKVVLVTGSSRSLGSTLVLNFAKKGANVVINYNKSKEEALKLKKEIELIKGQTLVIECDVAKEKEVENMIKKIIKEFGRIDILVNNAGICNDTLFDEKNSNDFKTIIDVNLIGTYLVSKNVGKHMLQQKKGKIINIASDNALHECYPESCDYDASKAGVISLTHNMAKYYAPHINVNCVCPGWIDTDMNKDLTETQKEEINKNILLDRFATKEEIANVVLFLASDKASYVNDSIITVNGGVK